MLSEISDFLKYLYFERKYSLNTIRNYHSSLKRFAYFLEMHQLDLNIHIINRSHIRSFIQSLGRRGFKPKTIHLDLCGVRSFFRFLEVNDYININPCHTIERIKLAKTLPNPLREEEIDRFFQSIDTSRHSGKRNYVLFRLALRTGLRASEIISLTLQDVSLTAATLYVREGKGKKDRSIPLSDNMCILLQDYLEHTRPHLVNDHQIEALFITERQKPMWEHSIRQLAHQYAKKAGLTYRQVSPHIFRYSFATQVAQKSKANITVLQELLGHESIQTTARYVGVNEEDKRKAVEMLDE